MLKFIIIINIKTKISIFLVSLFHSITFILCQCCQLIYFNQKYDQILLFTEYKITQSFIRLLLKIINRYIYFSILLLTDLSSYIHIKLHSCNSIQLVFFLKMSITEGLDKVTLDMYEVWISESGKYIVFKI